MPRGRIIAKSISKSEKVAKLSLPATLLFTWLIPHTDREGRLDADTWSLKALFPYIDEITPENIPALLEEIVDADLIYYYGTSHKYLQVKDFLKHNTHDRNKEAVSSIPAPEQVGSNSGVALETLQIQVKEEVKDKEKEREAFTHPPFFNLSSEKLKPFIVSYGKSVVDDYIQRINDHLSSTGRDPYLDYEATLRTWLKKDNVRKVAPIKDKTDKLIEEWTKDERFSGTGGDNENIT